MSLKKTQGYTTRSSSAVTRKPARNSYKKAPAAPRSLSQKISGAWPQGLAVKVPKFKKFGLICACVSAGAMLLVGICFGTLFLYDVATSSSYFATKKIEVMGNKRLSAEMIRDIAGVEMGDNSLDVSIAQMEQTLLATPWVETVSVKRVLPDTFVITVQERMPVFWVRKANVLYYADAKGTVIAPVATEYFMALPTLEVEPGAEDALAKLEEYLEDLKSGYLPVEFGAISALRLSVGRGIELYLDDREILLSVALDSWKKNLQRLSLALGDLARRNELSKVHEVRATDGNVWVSKHV